MSATQLASASPVAATATLEATAVATATAAVTATPVAGEAHRLAILHTNDVMGEVEPCG